MADEAVAGSTVKKGTGEYRRWLAGGGLAIAISWYQLRANTQEAVETRTFMRNQVASSQAEAKAAREQAPAMVEKMAVAMERTAAAQHLTANALQGVVNQQERICDSLDALTRQQESMSMRLDVARSGGPQ